jgi:tetrahydromethanopterin S-methyltransferase subunit A
MSSHMTDPQALALHVIHTQLREAIEAPKCHRCGCLQQTVEALSSTDVGQTHLAQALAEATGVFQPKHYECLGCPVCYPALAANAFSEAFPEAAQGLDLCPTETPDERAGWPPLPGDFHVVRYRAPVAVCTLNSDSLAVRLKAGALEGLAIVGTLHTENLGIERLIKNTLANPHIRFLIICGEDTRQDIGHLPGQSLQSLFEHGVDARGRIRFAHGKRPVLRNITTEEIQAFLDQIELVPLLGDERDDVIARELERCHRRDPGLYAGAVHGRSIEIVHAEEPARLTLDPAGYVVVYPDVRQQRLVIEHYTNAGVLDCMLEGRSPAALYTTAIARHLITRLDHAAYLGRELALAERSLRTGEPYVQDRAPGEVMPHRLASCETTEPCGCHRTISGLKCCET